MEKGTSSQRSAASEIEKSLCLADPMMSQSLGEWGDDALESIRDSLRHGGLEELVRSAIDMVLPEDVLPLRTDRSLFSRFSFEAARSVVVDALVHPDKLGDLTKAVRTLIGVPAREDLDFTLIETHVNVTDTADDLFEAFLALGFEPDNFHTLQPKCYRENFTLAFAPPQASRNRFHFLRGLVAERSKSVANLIQASSETSGFFEAEVYPHSWIRKYAGFREPTLAELENFPLRGDSFVVVNIPNTEREAVEQGIALSTRKLADVHVKIPTDARSREYPAATSTGVQTLRSLLLECGFYEIVSESGNAIYTGQFVDSQVAVGVFEQLDIFGKAHRCFLDLVCEPCVAFWRKESRIGGEVVLAEVSPVLIPRK